MSTTVKFINLLHKAKELTQFTSIFGFTEQNLAQDCEELLAEVKGLPPEQRCIVLSAAIQALADELMDAQQEIAVMKRDGF